MEWKAGFGKLKSAFKSFTKQSWANIHSNASFVKQFKAYIRNTTDLDNLKYVFNKNKASATDVKDAFEAMYKGKFKDDIFDTFWNNKDLKAKLFGGLEKIDAEKVFDGLVKNKSSKLYEIVVN